MPLRLFRTKKTEPFACSSFLPFVASELSEQLFTQLKRNEFIRTDSVMYMSSLTGC